MSRITGIIRAIPSIFTKIIVPLLAAILSGAAVLWFTPDWETQAREHGWVSVAEWQAEARRYQWLPEAECPAVPTKIQITSPGNGSRLPFRVLGSETYTQNVVVVTSSKPITINSPASIGLLIKSEMDTNYYVDFPLFDSSSDRKYLKTDYLSWRSILEEGTRVDVWAFYVDDRNSIGEIYTSLAQLESSSSVYAISNSVTWILSNIK